jgi:hypothetical protein|tara:strand:+ start:744 stop:1766 length:1023 start_codon:yes stop_codon:yes gene_type:complete
MTVDEFLQRIESIILQINEDDSLGTNQIGITTEQRVDILSAPTIQDASLYLLSSNIPQYVIDFATSGQDIAGVTGDNVALAAATEQYGQFGNQDAVLGVPANYTPPRSGATDFYTETDLVNLFGGKSEEEIAGIQADLINSNLLSVGDGFMPGEWDLATQRAFTPVLSRANRGGVTDIEKLNGAAWKTTLDEYVANPVPEIPQSETYLPADPATIAQKVKRLYAADLNRDPNPSELKLLSNTMYKEAENSYQQNKSLAATAQQQPEMTGEEILAGDYGNYAADNVQSTIEEQGLTQIDSESRMREKFDMITDKEKSRLGENYSARNTRATILNSIANRPN